MAFFSLPSYKRLSVESVPFAGVEEIKLKEVSLYR